MNLNDQIKNVFTKPIALLLKVPGKAFAVTSGVYKVKTTKR